MSGTEWFAVVDSSTRSTGDRGGRRWWRDAAVYQVYPRSFADGTADGVGDFAGVLARLEHFTELGVDAVWFSPFYPSSLHDGGYDVDDFRAVDPRIGTLEQFDEIVKGLHARGIRVIVDIVPNHSSDEHVLFQAAVASSTGSPERALYHFRPGLGENGELPPSDWQSLFGGSAWTRVPDGEWYLHLFSRHQPDWNWAHPAVHEEFERTLRFWGDRGVDGFRVDVAMMLAKDMTDPLPPWAQVSAGLPMLQGGAATAAEAAFEPGSNPIFDRDEVQDIYAAWRSLFEEYDPPLAAVAEAWVPPARRARYASAQSLGQAFNFDLMAAAWRKEAFREAIDQNLGAAAEAGSSSTWVLSNHDIVRHPTRYEPETEGLSPTRRRRIGLERGRAASLLMMALPGSAYIYQGEELGLPEVLDIPESAAQDPVAGIEGVVFPTRDGSRVPLPWDRSHPSFGFGAAPAHLPQPPWFTDFAASVQRDDPRSTLSMYRRALRLRRLMDIDAPLEWTDLGAGVLAFRRGTVLSVTNFSEQPVELPPAPVLLASDLSATATLPPNTSIWLGRLD
ncbi:glycoside hydrolase family 13 protein [Kineosporia babensis]|uniref:Glycoside hydrolase family 13 protein n=1 Tax=Kineosporia babensis TaxID=499548 RepID=A0A9X1NJ21_9ACTN|nr:glycoside hydrolase family 13 protein [Kineosporia babensis]MCD5314975.1 glycoside hydrolase family 13 protein [Kineosporia babensis]